MNPYELVKAEADAAAERTRCTTCNWLSSRPDEEREAWQDMLDQPTQVWATVHIFAAMRKAGYPSGSSSLSNHRMGHRGK